MSAPRFENQEDFQKWFDSVTALYEIITVCKLLDKIGIRNFVSVRATDGHRHSLEYILQIEALNFIVGIDSVLDFEFTENFCIRKIMTDVVEPELLAGDKFRSKVYRVIVDYNVLSEHPKPVRIKLEVKIGHAKVFVPFEILKIEYTEPTRKQKTQEG
jgi:hypothetical protein